MSGDLLKDKAVELSVRSWIGSWIRDKTAIKSITANRRQPVNLNVDSMRLTVIKLDYLILNTVLWLGEFPCS